jgi:HAD superfamily hydrolase (TIGR01509 family)
MLKAILFDSDGILVDTERVYFEATRLAFEAAGVTLSSEIWAKWYLGKSKGSRKLAERLGVAPLLIDKVLDRRELLFWTEIDQEVPVFPGVSETLSQLSGLFRLAVVTGAPRARFERVHASTRLLHYFEISVTRDESGEPKPDPLPYLTALKMLGLKAEECLAVEDSPRGAESAIAAGIKCCIIPTSLTDLTLCPPECRLLQNITQLPDFCAGTKTSEKKLESAEK